MLGLADRPEERANAALLPRQGVEIMPGSITDAELCARAMRGVTHVFHLAVAMREGGKSDEFFESVNLDGTRRLLEAAGSGQVERFVYCSTIGIYGHRAPGVTTEASRRSARATSTSGPRWPRSGWCGELAPSGGRAVQRSCGRRTCTARATSGCSSCSRA